jgi:hypothetical protein
MPRRLQLAVVCLVAAWAVLPPALGAEDVKDLKPRAKIVMDHGPLAYKLQDELVIRSAEELVAHSTRPQKSKDREVQREMSAALAKLFKVDAIDWDKQMVVGIMTGGGRGDAGNAPRSGRQHRPAAVPGPPVALSTRCQSGPWRFPECADLLVE